MYPLAVLTCNDALCSENYAVFALFKLGKYFFNALKGEFLCGFLAPIGEHLVCVMMVMLMVMAMAILTVFVMMLVIVAMALLTVLVMMLVIVAMALLTVLVMMLVMMLVIVAMALFAMLVVVMLMFMVVAMALFSMLVVMMVVMCLLFKLVKLGLKSALVFHGTKDGFAVELLPRSGYDNGLFILFAEK